MTAAHQEKVAGLRAELTELEQKSSQHCVVRPRPGQQEESALPEAERSEVEAELECPVCFEISRPPIYQVRNTVPCIIARIFGSFSRSVLI